MTVERHLILQELILRPSGEWVPKETSWTMARVAGGGGYWMQGGNARALNEGDGLALASSSGGRLRASQLGPLKVEWFTVQPQFLNGLLTVAEWHQLEMTPDRGAPRVLHFRANEPVGQKFAHIANQTRRDGLTMRCALLQLWAGTVSGWLASSKPPPQKEKPKANRIVVDETGQTFLNDQAVTIPELKNDLQQLQSENPDLSVVVKGADNVDYQNMINVLDVLQRLDITKVGLATE